MPRAKVAILTRIPTPYRDPIFRKLTAETDFDIEVLYCSKTQAGRDWEPDWLNGYRYEFLPGVQFLLPLGHTRHPFKINPIIWHKLSQANYDVVVMSGYADLTMQLATLWCWTHDTPYVLMSETHSLNPRGRVKRMIKEVTVRPIVRGATAYLPTGSLSKKYLEYYGGEPADMFFFPNTPDVAYFQQQSNQHRSKRTQIKSELGVTARFVILYVGRLVRVKGIEYLLQAFRHLRSERDDVALVVAGSGDLQDQLVQQAQVEHIPDVHFLGFIANSELPRLYAIADVFVLPSLHEPWGVVVNEAMACGLPVVATRAVGAAADLVQDGENGFVVPPRDAGALLTALETISQDDERRHCMGRTSQRLIQAWDYDLCLRSLGQAVVRCLDR